MATVSYMSNEGAFMKQVTDIVRKFFEDYERGNNALDLELLASNFALAF